jgi:hypothetical protein
MTRSRLGVSGSPREDLTGLRFGRLVVKEFHEVRGKGYWWCVCDCNPKEWVSVRVDKLKTGRTVSCGCFRADPQVRQAARWETPAERRKEIAAMGVAAKKKKGGSTKC